MFEPTSFKKSGLAIHPFPPLRSKKNCCFQYLANAGMLFRGFLFLFAFSESAQDLLAYCAFFAEYTTSVNGEKKQKNANHPTTQPPSQQPNKKKTLQSRPLPVINRVMALLNGLFRGVQKNPYKFYGSKLHPNLQLEPPKGSKGPALHEVDQVTIPKLIIALDVFTLRFFDEPLRNFKKTALFLVGER